MIIMNKKKSMLNGANININCKVALLIIYLISLIWTVANFYLPSVNVWDIFVVQYFGLVEAGGENIKKMLQEISNISLILEKAEHVLETLLYVHENNSDTSWNTNW